MSDYTSETITVLKGLEAVRKRPGMYVGDTTNGSGLHHLLWEVVANAVDQHLAGYASDLRVEIGANDWVTVHDDGAGIPVDPLPPPRWSRTERADTTRRHGDHVPAPCDAPERSVLEVVLTTLHTGPTYDGHFPHVHIGGPYGVGLAAVNALCERLTVETTRDGIRWSQTYERGEPVTRLRRLGPTTSEGTVIRFLPDRDIFSTITLDRDLVRARLEELAWLNPHLRVSFQERRLAPRGGVLGWARSHAHARGDVELVFGVSHAVADARVDIGFAWNDAGDAVTRAFVNMRETPRGTHVDAVWRAFTRYARSREAQARRASTVREALEPGLVVMIHVALYAPRFGSPTHDQLLSPEATKVVGRALAAYLYGATPSGMTAQAWRLRRFLDERLGVPRGDRAG